MQTTPFLYVAAYLACSPVLLAQGPLPFDFVDITDDVSAPEFPGVNFLFKTVGFEAHEAGGVAINDFDDDSLLDIYLPNTEFLPSKLYRNLGGGQFIDVAPALGIDEPSKRRAGGMFVDFDNDGDLDLLTIGYPGYTANLDLFSLFRNNGNPAFDFTDSTDSVGNFMLAPTAEDTLLGDYGGTCVGDYNGDGYADFLTTYMARLPGYFYDQMRLFRSELNAPALPGQTDHYPVQFVDGTIDAGLDSWFPGSTWTPSFVDYNRDGMLDLHINIDYELDILRLNDGNGVFLPDISSATGLNGPLPETRNEMGIAFGDIDHDGDLDQFQSNAYYGDRFYRNDSSFGENGTGLAFTDFAPQVTADQARYGWGVALSDVDNDRDLDLLRVAGMVTPQSNWFHENQSPLTLADGVTPLFVDRSDQVPQFAKTIGTTHANTDIAKSLVTFDLDNDGDLDLLVTRPGISPYINPGHHVRTVIYENTLNSGANWVRLSLRDTGGSQNVAGARVFLRSGGLTQMHEVVIGTSFLSQEPTRTHFGLGSDTSIDWIAARWPDGAITIVPNWPISGIRHFDRLPFDSRGDVNFDGKIDSSDFRLLRKVVLKPLVMAGLLGDSPYKVLGDLNGDNAIDLQDLVLLDNMLP